MNSAVQGKTSVAEMLLAAGAAEGKRPDHDDGPGSPLDFGATLTSLLDPAAAAKTSTRNGVATSSAPAASGKPGADTTYFGASAVEADSRPAKPAATTTSTPATGASAPTPGQSSKGETPSPASAQLARLETRMLAPSGKDGASGSTPAPSSPALPKDGAKSPTNTPAANTGSGSRTLARSGADNLHSYGSAAIEAADLSARETSGAALANNQAATNEAGLMASDQSSLDAVVATSSAGGASQIEPAALSGETSNAGKDDAARAADHDAVDHDAAGHDAGGAAASQSTQPLRTPVNTASIGDAVVSDPGLAMVPEASALASASSNAATPAASEQTAAAAPAASDFAKIADPAQIYVDDDQSVTSISRPGDSGSPHSNPPSDGTAPALAASASNPDSVTAAINPSTTSADPKAAQESLAKLGADAGAASAPQSSQNWRAQIDALAQGESLTSRDRGDGGKETATEPASLPNAPSPGVGTSATASAPAAPAIRPAAEITSASETSRVVSITVQLASGQTAQASVSERAGTVDVRIFTPTAASAERVSSEMDGMRQNLEGAGLKLGHAEVSYQGGDGGSSDRGGPGRERYQTPAQKPSDQAKEIFIMNEVPL